MLLDLVLALILLATLLGGFGRGLLATLGGLLGLVAGGAAAYWVVPLVNDWAPPRWRAALVVLTAVLLPLLGSSLGARIGHALRRGVDRTRLAVVDRLLGAVASVVVMALAMAFVGSAIAATGVPVLAPAIASSSVLRTIDRLTPAPVTRTMAQLRGAVLHSGLPQLGDLLGPQPSPTVPSVDLSTAPLAQASKAVARIQGTAYACGISSSGSGFVVATDRLVTNAHVVAGVDKPVVELPGQRAKVGRVVYLDPVNDLAVIAVDHLGVAPLPIVPTLARDAVAVVQGYPYGGPLTSGGARVLAVSTAKVPDIHGQGDSEREIYALATVVRPGNSGGPLLTTDGKVAGIVFARSDSNPDLAYAMTPAELLPVVARAPSLSATVPSGACTTG